MSDRSLQEEVVALRQRVAELETQVNVEQNTGEGSLWESDSRFRTLAQLAPVGIFFNDAEGRCIYVNPKLSELIDLSEQDALGFGWTEKLHPEDKVRVRTVWERAVFGKRSFKAEYRFVHDDGDIVWVIGDSVPVLSEHNTVLGYVGILTDITQEKQIEQERIQAQRLHALGDLSAGVSHNLNNILTGILGPAQLLETMTNDPEMRNEINTLVEASLRTKELVHRLHLSTRDGLDSTISKIGVNDIVQEAILTTQPRWKDESEANGIEIKLGMNLNEESTTIA